MSAVTPKPVISAMFHLASPMTKASIEPSNAAEAVWALVSGLPPGARERRLMMVLQAYVDDSGEQDDFRTSVFVLAGFVADSVAWASFSAEWERAIHAKPSIDYFKMAEASHLGGQFSRRRGWTADSRDQKVRGLLPLIRKYARLRIAVIIDTKAYASYIRSLPAPERTHRHDKPYFMAFTALITLLASSQIMHGLFGPCDFIFDEQGSIGNDAVASWDSLKQTAGNLAARGATDFRPFLGSTPIFRDEKCFLPLQAADLYAWQMRRYMHENKRRYSSSRTQPQRLLWGRK